MAGVSGLTLAPHQRLHRRWRGVVRVVPGAGAGDEVIKVDQLGLGLRAFDDLLQFLEEMLGDLYKRFSDSNS